MGNVHNFTLKLFCNIKALRYWECSDGINEVCLTLCIFIQAQSTLHFPYLIFSIACVFFFHFLLYSYFTMFVLSFPYIFTTVH